MKAYLILAALAFGAPAMAQKEKSPHVPAAVAAAFAKAHPGAKGHWEREGANYEVEFTEHGQKMSCILSRQGTIIETETAIRPDELPQAARAYLDQHYAKKKIRDAARLQLADGTLQYEAGLDKKDILFDGKGTFIKEEKD
ncbi:PepSY-like domain-containing protein [Flaviaesturariibacter terrae]